MAAHPVTPNSIVEYIEDSFHDVRTEYVVLDAFLFMGDEEKSPFVTIVTNDSHDPHSFLGRPGAFRLSISVGKARFQKLFGTETIALPEGDRNESGYDFTAVDTLMPHPVHSRMWWVCVVNPSAETFGQIQPLIAEAAEIATARAERQGSQSGIRYLIDPNDEKE